ncbi:MAG: hypothetical protein IT458_02655 [Planctomycetes bacterium]|nr:hypothetical protein [Planctomycetota bacterium]
MPTPPLRKRFRWLKRLGLLAASMLVALLVLELGVDLAIGEQVKFPRNVVGAPWGLRYNLPDSTYRHKSADVTVWFRINGQGMRADRDFAYAKPQGRRRIVTVGDSFTIGYEVAAENTFSAVLERELRQRGHDVEVLNAGVSGYSNAECLLYLERELHKYSPDAVVLSFYVNDLSDNIRSNLFRLAGERLVVANADYVPLGPLGDWLNRSRIVNFLNERSDAFALLKEQITAFLKRDLVQENLRNVALGEQTPATSSTSRPDQDPEFAYQSRLSGAILQRLLAWCREHGVHLVIQSIPGWSPVTRKFSDVFPHPHFATQQPGLSFVAMQPLLEPHVGQELLYYENSHLHWTPFAHAVSGRALAQALLTAGVFPAAAGDSGK